jgi:hypothetical protein
MSGKSSRLREAALRKLLEVRERDVVAFAALLILGRSLASPRSHAGNKRR